MISIRLDRSQHDVYCDVDKNLKWLPPLTREMSFIKEPTSGLKDLCKQNKMINQGTAKNGRE